LETAAQEEKASIPVETLVQAETLRSLKSRPRSITTLPLMVTEED
jgi:hypothetical protein